MKLKAFAVPSSRSRQDLVYGPSGLAVLFIIALVILSQAKKPSCPDDTNCPVKTLRMERAGALPRGATEGVVLELPPELHSLLIFKSQFETAEWWRKANSGGEYDSRLIARLEQAGLRYAHAHGGKDADRNGNDDGEEFVHWCIRTRRGARIFYKPNHPINLVGLDEQYAYMLDNNATNYPEQRVQYERMPLAEIYRRWHGYGGFARTLVYDPALSDPSVEPTP